MYQPTTIVEAVKLLTDNEGAIIIAGGSDILIELRDGKLPDCTLVSIRDIEEMQGVEMINGDIIIKPLSTFNEIYKNVQRFINIIRYFL